MARAGAFTTRALHDQCANAAAASRGANHSGTIGRYLKRGRCVPNVLRIPKA